MTMAPAPSAARSADSAVMVRTTPATSICRPPPALDVDRYRSTPASPCWGIRMRPSSPTIWRSAISATSVTALITPTVTSSKGASTVVGASPRTFRR